MTLHLIKRIDKNPLYLLLYCIIKKPQNNFRGFLNSPLEGREASLLLDNKAEAVSMNIYDLNIRIAF
jgi:hypothetical protein